MRRRLVVAIAAAAALAGCAAPAIVAPNAEVSRRAYANGGDTSLTLYTVISNRDDGGAHTALLIDASQRVLWDPAGSFVHPFAPEQNDLLYGITPAVELVYEDFHARETFRIVRQTVRVPPEVAEQALRLAAANGPAGAATCALTTSRILGQLPGFDAIGTTWFPLRAMRDFAAMPGVVTRTITDDDADDNHGVLIRAMAN